MQEQRRTLSFSTRYYTMPRNFLYGWGIFGQYSYLSYSTIPLNLLEIKRPFLPALYFFQPCTVRASSKNRQCPTPLLESRGWFSRLSTRQVLSKTGFQAQDGQRALMYADGHRTWKRGCLADLCRVPSLTERRQVSRTGADHGTAWSNGVPPDDPRNPETR